MSVSYRRNLGTRDALFEDYSRAGSVFRGLGIGFDESDLLSSILRAADEFFIRTRKKKERIFRDYSVAQKKLFNSYRDDVRDLVSFLYSIVSDHYRGRRFTRNGDSITTYGVRFEPSGVTIRVRGASVKVSPESLNSRRDLEDEVFDLMMEDPDYVDEIVSQVEHALKMWGIKLR